jgi:hypothetical protein
MEQAQMTTDNLRNVMATVDAMQTANKEMKKQYKNVNLDKIDVRYQKEFESTKRFREKLNGFYNSNYKMRWKI